MAIYMWREYVNPRKGPCPDGFHIPTKDELVTLRDYANNVGVTDGTGFRDYFKMPYAGFREYNSGNTYGQRSYGYIWSSSAYSDNYSAYNFRFFGSAFNPQNDLFRPYGCPIRPFKDTPVTPDSNWTVLKQGTGTAGVYHNSTLGLISVSWNGTTWITIADKNLGATAVYNSGDDLSESNCGKYYQRGNNYGFPFTGTVATSTLQVNASAYGPGNYYSSSTFIIGSYNRDISNNKNLRGGEEA